MNDWTLGRFLADDLVAGLVRKHDLDEATLNRLAQQSGADLELVAQLLVLASKYRSPSQHGSKAAFRAEIRSALDRTVEDKR